MQISEVFPSPVILPNLLLQNHSDTSYYLAIILSEKNTLHRMSQKEKAHKVIPTKVGSEV